MNARPRFLPPGTPRWRKTLAWLGVVAAGVLLGLAILLIAAFAVNKLFPPPVVEKALPHGKAARPSFPGPELPGGR